MAHCDKFRVQSYTSDRPDFSELVELYNAGKELSELVEALATCYDVVQRSADLHSFAYDLLEKITNLVKEE